MIKDDAGKGIEIDRVYFYTRRSEKKIPDNI